MAASQSGKSKSSTEAQKTRRAKSWARGVSAKAARADAQHKRAEANRDARRRGEPTPWEIACQRRSERRAEAARRMVGHQS